MVKDPIGDKGARLSANITIPGRLLILVANSPGVALSRRIEGEDERARRAGWGAPDPPRAEGLDQGRAGVPRGEDVTPGRAGRHR